MNVEDVENLWGKYESLLLKVSGENIDAVKELIQELGQRIIECPASRQKSEFRAEFGGLVAHSLDVAKNVVQLAEVYGLDDKKSAVFVALLHGVGKIGDLEHVYFVDQESNWHRERGIMYDWNSEIPKMSITHRTNYLLQHFGIKLSREEWVAIQLSGGSHIEENRFYVGHEPLIAIVLQQAIGMAIRGQKV